MQSVGQFLQLQLFSKPTMNLNFLCSLKLFGKIVVVLQLKNKWTTQMFCVVYRLLVLHLTFRETFSLGKFLPLLSILSLFYIFIRLALPPPPLQISWSFILTCSCFSNVDALTQWLITCKSFFGCFVLSGMWVLPIYITFCDKLLTWLLVVLLAWLSEWQSNTWHVALLQAKIWFYSL